MKTVIIRVGKSPSRTRKSAELGGALEDLGDRSQRSAALFVRAKLLAILGAAVCVAFFAIRFAENEVKTPQPNSPTAAVAVAASADAYDAERSTGGIDAPDGITVADSEDTSIWARLEKILRRLMNRENN